MEYFVVKWLHILSSTLLFGTGIGSAFYMLTACLLRDARQIAGVVRWVIVADWLFTATSGVLQPLTGWWLMQIIGYPLATPWILYSLLLYVIAAACWIPVVWIQYRLHALARAAAEANMPLPARFDDLFRVWVLLGIPAFTALVVIYGLMVFKPGG